MTNEELEQTTYKFAEWYVSRQPMSVQAGVRRITVKLWAETSKIEITDEEAEYVLRNFHWFLEPA